MRQFAKNEVRFFISRRKRSASSSHVLAVGGWAALGLATIARSGRTSECPASRNLAVGVSVGLLVKGVARGTSFCFLC
jgi:hypothetical protein